MIASLFAVLASLVLLAGCSSVPQGTPGTLLVYVQEENNSGVNNALLSTKPQIPPGTVRDNVVPGLLLPPPLSEGPLTTISYTAPEWIQESQLWRVRIYGPREASVARGKERKVTLKPANPGRIEVAVVGPNWNPSNFSGVVYVTKEPFNAVATMMNTTAATPLIYAEAPFQGARRFRFENLPTGTMFLYALTKDAEGRPEMAASGQINVSSGRVFDTTLALQPVALQTAQ